MVSLDILKNRGFTKEAIKEMAEKVQPQINPSNNPNEIPVKVEEGSNEEKFQKFLTRVNSRIDAGRQHCITNYKHYHALDLAWDAPLRQVSPTLLRSLLDSDPTKPEIESALRSWGFNLSEVIEEYVPDPKTPNKVEKRINIPAFNQIIVPLVKSYVTIRQAKIMNDRRTVPFLPFDAAISTAVTRLQCEAITHRVEVMGQQYGHFEAVNQAVFHMLLYSYGIMLPVEEWHVEYQEVATKDESQCSEKVGDETRYYRIIKEGIRYVVPHPAKTFTNRAYKQSSINTDTGVDYIGYWRIVPFKEIYDNEAYFNRDKISFGGSQWWTEAGTYLNSIFGSCNMSWPSVTEVASENDREKRNANSYNSKDHMDRSVTLTEYWEKLIPKDIGIGTYDCPVWTRWVVCGDGTINYGAPVPYAPGVFMAYDIDDNRDQNASLGLEILPFQDHFSNLMSQYILSLKQNLSNVNFYDKDQVDETTMDVIRNLGEKWFRKLNWVPFSSNKTNKSRQNIEKVFHSQKFTPLDTQSQVQAMKTVLEVLERVLVMSAQEVGQSASHELRAEEVRSINQSTSSRLKFTSIPVDEAMDAMKRQIYTALMEYGEIGYYVLVAHDPLLTKEVLKELGFTSDDKKHILSKNAQKVVLKVEKKSAVLIDSFVSHRDSIDRANNAEVAVGLAQALSGWLSNPMLAQAIGPDQAIDLINMITRLGGAPRDFVIKPMPTQGQMMTEDIRKELLQAVTQLIEQSSVAVLNQVKQGIEPVLVAQKQIADKVMQHDQALQEVASGV